jgi:hypothetical protein
VLAPPVDELDDVLELLALQAASATAVAAATATRLKVRDFMQYSAPVGD